MTHIGEKAFNKCEALEEVVFGDSVEIIGDRSFYKCASLTSLTLPDSLDSIGDYAFYKCEALATLNLGGGIASIGNSAFYGCSAIEAVSFPRSLTHIGKQAFRNCTALTSVVLSGSVTEVMDHAFYGCSALTVYTELTKAGEDWSGRWNSSYRPVIWGCNISEEGDYVVSLTKEKNTVLNRNASNTVSNPTRAGYTFGGWGTNSTANAAAYTSETLADATNGRTL